MVDIEVPTCCSTKTALFDKVHVVCMSIFIMFGELYVKTQVLCPRGHIGVYCLWLHSNLCYPAPRPLMAHDALEGTLAHQWVAAASLIPGVLLPPQLSQYVLFVCVGVCVCGCVGVTSGVCICMCVGVCVTSGVCL